MLYEVRGAGKNPEAEVWGIFVPTADRLLHSLGKTSHPCIFAFITHFICEDIGILEVLRFLTITNYPPEHQFSLG